MLVTPKVMAPTAGASPSTTLKRGGPPSTSPSEQLHHQAMRKGTDKDWEQRAGCMTFPEAVAKAGPGTGATYSCLVNLVGNLVVEYL